MRYVRLGILALFGFCCGIAPGLASHHLGRVGGIMYDNGVRSPDITIHNNTAKTIHVIVNGRKFDMPYYSYLEINGPP